MNRGMNRCADVRDLRAWQLAHQMNLRVELFLACSEFRTRFSLCAELAEAARSGARSIAEGYASEDDLEFAAKVRLAWVSQQRVLQLLRCAWDQRLLTADEYGINHCLARRAMRAAAILSRQLASTRVNVSPRRLRREGCGPAHLLDARNDAPKAAADPISPHRLGSFHPLPSVQK